MISTKEREYDYLNARVRGMSVSLLEMELLEQILEAENEEVLVDALLDSSYGPELSFAASGSVGTDVIEDAIKRNLNSTVRKVCSIAPEGPRRLLEIQLGKWDVTNIIAVIRGIRHGGQAERVGQAIVPVGSYGPAQLVELAREPDLRSLANMLTQADSPLGPVLRRSLLANREETDFSRTESELYVAYFVMAFEELDSGDRNGAILRDHLRLQADMLNVMGVLKQLDSRARNVSEPDILRIPGGFIRPAEIKRMYEARNMELALEQLGGTEFAPALERGILAFGQTNRLSVLERFLEAQVLERGIALFRKDPLSICVPLGFIWRKINEFLNIRILARGRQFRLPPSAMREEMVLV